jgi:hypothetical protein
MVRPWRYAGAGQDSTQLVISSSERRLVGFLPASLPLAQRHAAGIRAALGTTEALERSLRQYYRTLIYLRSPVSPSM